MKQTIFDPLVLAKISSMILRARFVVEGFIAGMHQSPFRGYSIEFAQHREYSPGDELKHLDWKVYGKTDRFYVKQYQEETNLKAYLVLDASNSMSFASRKISKLQYGTYLTAALAYLMLKQQDAVGLAIFSSSLDRFIPPRSQYKHVSVLFNELEKIKCQGETSISQALKELGQYTKRRGLIILISDLFDQPSEVLRALNFFRFQKHEIIVFHLLDPAEKNLPYQDLISFEDMETKEKIVTRPEVIRREYEKCLADFINEYKLNFLQNNIDYCPLITNQPLDIALCSYLAKRELLL
ncbi:MAG: DUF58 domain-containing protein [Elusimicrobiota bacterium]